MQRQMWNQNQITLERYCCITLQRKLFRNYKLLCCIKSFKLELVFSLAECVSEILFLHCPTSAVTEHTRPVLIATFSFCLITAWFQLGLSLTFPPSFKLMSVPTCAARKMFPKRKLEESRSGSESQKEEAEANEEQGHLNKRPRVETTANSAGTPSPLLLQQPGSES